MGRNILVVEDDHNISDLIHMYLVKEGFDVRIAGDGGKAIEEFQKEVPDLTLAGHQRPPPQNTLSPPPGRRGPPSGAPAACSISTQPAAFS